jgi:hypothetical protein
MQLFQSFHSFRIRRSFLIYVIGMVNCVLGQSSTTTSSASTPAPIVNLEFYIAMGLSGLFFIIIVIYALYTKYLRWSKTRPPRPPRVKPLKASKDVKLEDMKQDTPIAKSNEVAVDSLSNDVGDVVISVK